MQLTFLGATRTVTGSKYLIEAGRAKILIDCGMYQGIKPLRMRNWEPFPIDPKTIDAVLLTHAHIDHTGYLPRLMNQGFKGRVICSASTKALCDILLPDSGHLHEEEARLANKYGYSKHQPALPLYTREDAMHVLKYFQAIEFNKVYTLSKGLTYEFKRIGHIIGAACIEIKYQDTSILFSGDIGRFDNEIAVNPSQIDKVDYLVVESTYGDRLHDMTDPMDQLDEVINRTVQRGGTVVIPAFAVGRTPLILYYLYQLQRQGRIPNIPIYLDSPMAINATDVFLHHSEDHRLSEEMTKKICELPIYVNLPEDSQALDRERMPSVIISASGMATGGRILHHLKVFLRDHRSTVIFVGYQSQGTRGARLISGEKEIKIHGAMIPVEAEIICMHSLSAHADYNEILKWLHGFKGAPKKVFITHGEIKAAESLKEKIEDDLNWPCNIPEYLQKEKL